MWNTGIHIQNIKHNKNPKINSLCQICTSININRPVEFWGREKDLEHESILGSTVVGVWERRDGGNTPGSDTPRCTESVWLCTQSKINGQPATPKVKWLQKRLSTLLHKTDFQKWTVAVHVHRTYNMSKWILHNETTSCTLWNIFVLLQIIIILSVQITVI